VPKHINAQARGKPGKVGIFYFIPKKFINTCAKRIISGINDSLSVFRLAQGYVKDKYGLFYSRNNIGSITVS